MTAPKPIALVTGASRGIGRAIAEALAADNYAVAINYAHNADAAEAAVTTITAAGGTAFALAADLGDLNQIEKLFQAIDARTRATGETLALLVNNAGVDRKGLSFEDTDPQTFDAIFGVNVRGTFFATQAAVERMSQGGAIVNVTSALARKTFQSQSVYGASKAALNAMTLHWAGELGPRGIRVNAVAPGAIDTDLNADWIRAEEGRAFIANEAALRRVAEPKDVADVVAFLASDRARWVTGEVIETSGGWRL